MMKTSLRELLGSLQLDMLRAGGRLPSLDIPQNQRGIGNNNIEGKAYVQPKLEGETTIMATTTKEETSSKKEEIITPAGGASDAEVAKAVATVFSKMGELAGNAVPKTYGRRMLEEAIPAATTALAVVAVYGGITLINNKWGRGALERDKLALLERQGVPPQMG